MLGRLRQAISPPDFGDIDKTRMAGILNAMLLILLGSSLIFGIFLAVSSPLPWRTAAAFVVMDFFLIVVYLLMRSGRVRMAGYLLILSIWAILTYVTASVYGGLSNPLISAYIVVIVASGLLLGIRVGVAFAGLCYLTILGFYITGMFAIATDYPILMTPERTLIFYTFIVVLTVAYIYIINDKINKEIKRTQQHESELVQSNEELQAIRETLEQTIETRSAEILQQSQFFKALVENNPIAIVTLDLHNKIISCNHAFEILFGYSQAEIVGQNLDELITTDFSREKAKVYTQRVIEGQTVHRTGVRRKKDGSLVDVEIFGVPVIVEHEQICLLGLYHNISEQKQAEEALRKSEEKYRDLVENINDVMYAADENGIVTYVSPAVKALLGYHPSEVIGHNFREFVDKDDIPDVLKQFRNILSGHISTREYRVQTKSGEKRWMRTSSRPIVVGERVTGVQGVLSDITERIQTEEALRESEEKFRTLAEQSPNMVFINKGGRVVYANKRCEEVMGYTREELYGPDFNFLDLISPEHRDLVMSNFQRHLVGEELEPYEYALLTKSNERIEVILTTRMMKYEGERAILGTVTDITERKRAEERLAYIATHDSLTDLPNRSLFYDRLDHAIHTAKRSGYGVAVAFLDLDGFKSVNDTYGHEKGDFLLKDVAMRLNGCVRESDSVARLGGDEFTFVFEKIRKPSDATTIVEKIINTLSAPFEINGHLVYVTASIGISLYPEDGDETAELLKKADSAMYQAKDLAQNSYQLYS